MNKQDKIILEARLGRLIDSLRTDEFDDRLGCLCPGENCDDDCPFNINSDKSELCIFNIRDSLKEAVQLVEEWEKK